MEEKKAKNKPSTICIADFGRKSLSSIAFILGQILSKNNNNVLLLDLTKKNFALKKSAIKSIKSENVLFDNLTYERIERPKGHIDLINFNEKIKKRKNQISKDFSFVIILVDNVETDNASMKQLFECDYFLLISKAGQLTKSNLVTIESILRERLNSCLSIMFFKK